ncbi:MAG: TonB-dependent receptor, partial [Thauera sp.]|nr:TonB-dependent receptor [Thauera sp.]
GKLFPDNTHVYVYPSRPRGTDASATVTLDNVVVPANLRHLLAHLKENDKLVAVQPHDDTHLHIDIGEVLSGLRRGRGEWEADVPAGVAQRIIEGRLLGYDTE